MFFDVLSRTAARSAGALVILGLALGTVSCQYDPSLTPPGPTPNYELTIAKYRGDKLAAVSYTLDDGYQEQYDIALPIFESYGIPATCFVIVGATRDRKIDPTTSASKGKLSWEELRDSMNRGFEIGNHSMRHLDLTKVTDELILMREIIASADTIALKTHEPPLVFAFPYSKSTPQLQAMALSKHVAVRQGNVVSFGSGATVSTLVRADALIGTAILLQRWVVPVIHGIGSHYQALDPEMLRQHLQFVKSRESEVWIATYSAIARYAKERPVTQYPILWSAPQHVDFAASCPLDSAIYDVPLTFVLDTGAADIISADAVDLETQTHLPLRVDGSTILVDVVPTPVRFVAVSWSRR